MQNEPEPLYCENDECRVLIYQTVAVGQDRQRNCPGCGQFGRAKGR